MISLKSTTDTLQAFLSGAAATTNPTVIVQYYDIQVDQKIGTGEYPSGRQDTVLAGASETAVLAAPAANVCRHVDSLSLYNADTAAVTATICIDANGTNRIIIKVTLGVGYTLHGEFGLRGRGWYVTDANGGLVTSESPAYGTYTPTYTNTTNLDASTPNIHTWYQIGNLVHVSGSGDVDPTAAGPTSTVLGISLPVATNFSSGLQANGVMSSGAVVETGIIRSESTGDIAQALFMAVSTASHTIRYEFTYQVLP